MSEQKKPPLKCPDKLGTFSFLAAIVAYYSYFLNLSLGPVFWLLLLVACSVFAFGAGITGIAIGGTLSVATNSAKKHWVGLILSLAGILIASISIYRAIDALTNW